MTGEDGFRNLIDKTKGRGQDARGTAAAAGGAKGGAATQEPDPPAPADADDAYSVVSADRQHKLMVVFRFKDGNAKALAYSYLVGIDFDPSEGIVLDFSAYEVRVSGRNLAPLFAGLVAQRVAVVQEQDDLQAEATLPKDATVVTGIVVSERE
jgi:hypothetical protein